MPTQPAPDDALATHPDRLIDRHHVATLHGVEADTISHWSLRGDPRVPPPVVQRHGYTRWRLGDVLDRIRAMREPGDEPTPAPAQPEAAPAP